MPERDLPRDAALPGSQADSPAPPDAHAEELAHSLSLLRATLEATTDAILVTDSQGTITLFNEKFVAMWSMPREVVKSGDTSRMIAVALPQLKDPQQFLAKIEELRADHDSASFDVLELGDGRTIERYSNPQRIDDRGVGRVWSFRDVSARKRADADLSFKTAFLEALFNCSHDGLLVVDSHGKKVLQNQRLADLWKIPKAIADDTDDAIQVEFVTRRTKDPQQFIERVVHLYSHPQERSHDEIELIDGTVLDRDSYPIFGADGMYYGRIWSFRDITARKSLEEQLRQAQKMEAVGRLAGGIAHDFNNILGVITGHGDLLAREIEAPDPRLRRLEEIRRAAQRAVALTRQILAFSRRQVVQTRELSLNVFVKELEPMLRSLLGENVELVFTATPDPTGVRADPGQIGQAIMNLATNAREAMPNGGRLTLETANVELDANSARHHPGVKPGFYVMLAVSDTGVGMDAETLSHVFEPFFTTKPPGQGSGLGLATVHGIVSRSEGYMRVQSEPGHGSSFRIHLPRVEMDASGGPPAEPAGEVRGGLETILLVDDEPALKELNAEVLQEYGYDVIAAGSATEALELAARRAGPIHLLLTDVAMPGESGGQLSGRLLRLRPRTKILYMSGYASDALVQLGVSAATAAFIEKPFAPVALARKVREVLDS